MQSFLKDTLMTALAEDGRIRVMFKKRGINQPS